MPTETPITPDYAAAWATIRQAAENAAIQSGSTHANDDKIALIEPGIRLLELSAAYRAAHAVWDNALTPRDRDAADEEMKALDAAWVAKDAVRDALLSAALDIR